MYQRGIRGAITVNDNTPEEITSAVCELLEKIISENKINTEDISHVIFTMTDDLDTMYGAKAARENIKGFEFVPMLCVPEQIIFRSMKKCLRVLVVVNTELSQKEIRHIYLRGAKDLRKDIINE